MHPSDSNARFFPIPAVTSSLILFSAIVTSSTQGHEGGHFDTIQGGGSKLHCSSLSELLLLMVLGSASGRSWLLFSPSTKNFQIFSPDFTGPACQPHGITSSDLSVCTHFLTPLCFPFQWLSLSVISFMNRRRCKACLKNSCWILQT